MNYLPMMTDEEIKYICSVIPLREAVRYFKRYPRDFAKIMPGFRAISLKDQEQLGAVLYRSLNQSFISTFIEKQINRWIKEIKREIILLTDKGASKECAWLQILPFCYFVDNIELFFKLINEEQSDELVSLLSASVKEINDLNNRYKKLESSFNESKSEQTRLSNEVERIQIKLEKSRSKLSECSTEREQLKISNTNFEKLKDVILSFEHDIEKLKKEIQDRDELVQQQKIEISALTVERQQLEKNAEEHVDSRAPIYMQQKVKPRRPKDIEEFKDFLGYNLENLNIPTDSDYYALLKSHLCEILFQGKPIIINRSTCMVLMECISNTLIGTANVPTLSFSPNMSEREIKDFLSVKNRIVCLDNFIGNFNETILLTICDYHKDKIIFLTMLYDRTLHYVPQEFLQYCHYLNLNRIVEFSYDHKLTEDPSALEEIEASSFEIMPGTRWSRLLKEILEELDLCKTLSTYKSSLVSDEETLCSFLAFDALPFCIDVLKTSPYSVSERLNKYAGDSGRCLYKELFRRWFS